MTISWLPTAVLPPPPPPTHVIVPQPAPLAWFRKIDTPPPKMSDQLDPGILASATTSRFMPTANWPLEKAPVTAGRKRRYFLGPIAGDCHSHPTTPSVWLMPIPPRMADIHLVGIPSSVDTCVACAACARAGAANRLAAANAAARERPFCRNVNRIVALLSTVELACGILETPRYFISGATDRYSALKKNLKSPCGCERLVSSLPNRNTWPLPTSTLAISMPLFITFWPHAHPLLSGASLANQPTACAAGAPATGAGSHITLLL